MSAFGHCQKRLWCPTFKLDRRREPGEAAGGIKVAAEYEAAVQEKQRIWRETRDLDGFAGAGQDRWMARREQIYRFQRMASKALVFGLDCTQEILSKVNFATLQLADSVRPAQNLDQFHIHLGISAGVLVQEISDQDRKSVV